MTLWMGPGWCSTVQGHVWLWSADATTNETMVPDGTRCACGAYVWINGVATLATETLIA